MRFFYIVHGPERINSTRTSSESYIFMPVTLFKIHYFRVKNLNLKNIYNIYFKVLYEYRKNAFNVLLTHIFLNLKMNLGIWNNWYLPDS